jgi:hypothetical protein
VGLAGAVVAVGGRRVVEGQSFQAGLKVVRAHLGVARIVCRTGACILGEVSLFG